MSSRVGGRLGILALLAVASLMVMFLAWPRFLASFRFLPVEHALDRYFYDNEIESDRLEVLIEFAGEALEHHEHQRYRYGLSQLYYLRGLDPATPAAERRDAYRSAEEEALAALRLAPAQTAVWMHLAMTRWILRGEPRTIIDAWKMSVFTGRTHSSLYTRRVEMGLAYREYLDHEGLAMLRDQIRLAWRTRPGALAAVLLRQDPQLRVLRNFLDDSDPELTKEMEVWLERLR
ncbi:MAG: hypothetical protein KJN78_04850 [Gammaproteobacteria bacterium]|nr:hypothetical protein [Gammaproteobacteria bacterium]